MELGPVTAAERSVIEHAGPGEIGSKIAVSVLVLTRNEELRIPATLAACGYFDDVWIIDSKSTDNTVELAKKAGARVVNFVWDGKYPKKKQWALDHVDLAHDWVLFLDADEVPGPSLRHEIEEVAASDTDFGAYDVSLEYHFSGRALHHGYQVSKRILVHRARARFPEVDDIAVTRMGEIEGHYQPITTFRTGRLHGTLIHDDVSPLSAWLARHDVYSDWEAYLRTNPLTASQVRRARSRQGQLFARMPAKPAVFFLYSYLVKRGFLDGRAGFNYAYALSFYYWMIGEKADEISRQSFGSS